jgi:hypothetical protein
MLKVIPGCHGPQDRKTLYRQDLDLDGLMHYNGAAK